MSITLDANTFHKRANILLKTFKNFQESEFNGAQGLLFVVGSADDSISYQKSTALQTWLLGYEFPEMITFITPTKFVFLTSQKKGAILSTLSLSDKSAVPFEILTRTKDESQNKEQYDKLLSIINEAGKKVGVVPKDSAAGKLVDEWKKVVGSNLPWEEVDVSTGIALAFSIKDSEEIKLVSSAATLSSLVMKNYFVDEMSNAIDQGKSITHEQFTARIEALFAEGNEKRRAKLRIPSSIPVDYADWCYPPVVQSGGKYELKPSAMSNSDKLHEGTIVAFLGVRFKSYCSNIGRTYLMNPESDKEKNYEFLLELQKHVLGLVKPETTCADLYKAAVGYVDTKRPDLSKYFLKNIGFGMGLEFRESTFLLSPRSSRPLQPGMVLNLALGFQNIEKPKAKSSKDRTYSLFLADTVVVSEDGSQVLTDAEKDLKNISYTFGDSDEDGDGDEEMQDLDSKAIMGAGGKRTRSGAVLDSKLRGPSDKAKDEEKRKAHQKQLASARHDEGVSRFAEGKDGKAKEVKMMVRKFESYRKEGSLPKSVSELRITIDRRAETIVLPIYGQPVPFHLSTIKNVSKTDEQDFALLRFNFITPGQTLSKKDGPVPYEDPNATFIRSVSYRSSDLNRMTEIAREINEMKKEIAKRESERAEMADLVEQADLVEVKGRRPIRLPDVYVRPGLEGKRFPGDLEIHTNGLRYQSQLKSDQKIDILFSNIKHLFFQPCDGELIVLLHIHLKNHIMIGKKKTKDVQFYREVSDASFDETGNRRRRVNYGDEDELAQEQEERRRRALLNKEFQAFSEKVHESSRNKVDVDIPFKELAFQGVPHRQLVTLQPTTECLVHLSDLPFLVINLSEVETAHLERVQFGLKNFDLVFVFKDFSRPVVHVNTIPMNHLEHVKEWLDSMDIPFSEGPVNLSWPQIMKTINDDPKGFFEAGGWSFLQPESSDGDISSDSASEFEMDGSDFAEESESGSDFSEGDSDESDSDASGSDEGDESGDDWDELDRKAAEHDRRKREREEEDVSHSKKSRGRR